MASNTVFFCKECGYESAKWLGRCPGCNNWNTFVEEKVNKKSSSKSSGGRNTTFGGSSTVKKLNDIVVTQEIRLDTGYEELNRVFGGGIVEGSLNLIGGEPGIGKSTLIMQVCAKLANHGKVLYISGEESETQVKLRADRLNVKSDNILFFNETNIEVIEEKLEELAPKFCIVDSIQTMYDEQISSTPGSISQVKEVTGRLMYQAKKQNITTIVIGHVTKDGVIAGPRILEHMVDTVIYIEGERFLSHRIVRGVKNRFGSTNEIGMFEMQNEGLIEITDPSKVLISEREENPSGSVIVATMEGTRPLLVEFQALTTPTIYGLPRRTANGIDYETFLLDGLRSDHESEEYIANEIMVFVESIDENGNTTITKWTRDDNELFVQSYANRLTIDGNEDIQNNSLLYTPDFKVFSSKLNQDKTYEIKFGNGITGKRLKKGDRIYVMYLDTNGPEGKITLDDVDISNLKFKNSPTEFGLSEELY